MTSTLLLQEVGEHFLQALFLVEHFYSTHQPKKLTKFVKRSHAEKNQPSHNATVLPLLTLPIVPCFEPFYKKYIEDLEL